MSEQLPCVITISRMLGSGGAYLGQRIASRLGIVYADREIVRQAAETLKVSEEVGESFDEKMTPLF
jgi:cytidylate kinase